MVAQKPVELQDRVQSPVAARSQTLALYTPGFPSHLELPESRRGAAEGFAKAFFRSFRADTWQKTTTDTSSV